MSNKKKRKISKMMGLIQITDVLCNTSVNKNSEDYNITISMNIVRRLSKDSAPANTIIDSGIFLTHPNI